MCASLDEINDVEDRRHHHHHRLLETTTTTTTAVRVFLSNGFCS